MKTKLQIILSLILITQAYAGSATWIADPVSSDWNTAANWTPAVVPNGPADVATFGVSKTTAVSLSADTEVNSIVFDPGASAFSIMAESASLTITGAGITNSSGVLQNFTTGENTGGVIEFSGSAVAGIQTAFDVKGFLNFFGFSSAASATLINNGETITSGSRGITHFFDASTAADARIINTGPTGTGGLPGLTIFLDSSAAGNATFIANGGTLTGGIISMNEDSSGGTARVVLRASTAIFDMFSHNGPGITIGSLEGQHGLVHLGGDHNLAIGSNGRSTVFSGTIEEGFAGRGGSLTKIGNGILELRGENSYTGGTTVNAGTLIISNTANSGTGNGGVQVNAGTFAGSGIIAGRVRVGTGSGVGAFLAPAAGVTRKTTLTIQRSLTFEVDSTYTYTFKARGNQARTDLVIADGVTIHGGTIDLQGTTQGTLETGLILTVISNTSANPISGTFSNLADGAIVNVNGTNFQASYEGGDGNDLTLTVVP